MKLSDISIRRPVLASMLSLALVLFGVIGYRKLPVREYPDVDPPIISVTTVLPGRQSAGRGVGGHRHPRGGAQHRRRAPHPDQLERRAVQQHHAGVHPRPRRGRRRAGRARQGLPGARAGCREDIEEPVIAKQEADAQPFFWLALSGENYDLLQLSDIADRLVKSAAAEPGRGGQRRSSPASGATRCGSGSRTAQLAARGLTVQDVEARHPQPQRRDPGRPDRVGPARVHGPLARRAQDAGGVRRAGGGEPGRPAGQAQGPGPGRARARRTSAARSASRARRRSASAWCGSPRPT